MKWQPKWRTIVVWCLFPHFHHLKCLQMHNYFPMSLHDWTVWHIYIHKERAVLQLKLLGYYSKCNACPAREKKTWESVCIDFVFRVFFVCVIGIEKVSMNYICSQHRDTKYVSFLPTKNQFCNFLDTNWVSYHLIQLCDDYRVSVCLHTLMGSFPRDCPHFRCQSQILGAQGTCTRLSNLAIKLGIPQHSSFSNLIIC